ncbi:MAG: hypothetical protein IJ752_08105 [Alphaproteobacteria bacterium]|nr:hypothetical protein [Alphaproteobacteria bacterium]
MEKIHIKRKGQRKAAEREAPVGSAATRKLLRAYLEEAIVLTKGKSKSEAKHLLKDYFDKADKKALLDSPDALAVVEAKEKKLEEKAKGASLKAKANYASDADVAGLSDTIAFGVAGVATSMLAPIVATDVNLLSGTMLAATAAYTAVKGGKALVAEMSVSKTPQQAKDARDYARVKHAQLALKLLKKEIEAPIKAAEKAKRKEEIAQLFAVGYGQPSGGLIQKPVQAAMLKKQKSER